MTPVVTGGHPAGDHRPFRFESQPDSNEPELVETAEDGQIRGGEGRIGHVEVGQLVGVEPPSSGDLDPYPGTDTPAVLTPRLQPQLG